MNVFKSAIQHRLNPLHVYCRLREFGLGNASARVMCACYERLFYRPFMPRATR